MSLWRYLSGRPEPKPSALPDWQPTRCGTPILQNGGIILAYTDNVVMARRGGALFLGLAAMLFLARNAESSPTRRAISIGLCLACATLAMLGLGEWIAGDAGVGIGLAAFFEFLLSASFARTAFRD